MKRAADHSPIDVVAAVIARDGKLLVTRRLRGTHLGGLWEFPGGKVHAGEERIDALGRELREELGIDIIDPVEIFTTTHAYPEKTVTLHFYSGAASGEPKPLLGQELRWIDRAHLRTLEFPAADAELIDQLVDARL